MEPSSNVPKTLSILPAHSPSFVVLKQEAEALKLLLSLPKSLDHAILEKMRNMLTIIVNNGNFWKEFKKWSKERVTVEKLDRSDITKIVKVVKSGFLGKASLENLQERLQEVDELHRGRVFPRQPLLHSQLDEPFPSGLKGFDHDFITEALTKHVRQLKKILAVIEGYQVLETHTKSPSQKHS